MQFDPTILATALTAGAGIAVQMGIGLYSRAKAAGAFEQRVKGLETKVQELRAVDEQQWSKINEHGREISEVKGIIRGKKVL